MSNGVDLLPVIIRFLWFANGLAIGNYLVNIAAPCVCLLADNNCINFTGQSLKILRKKPRFFLGFSQESCAIAKTKAKHYECVARKRIDIILQSGWFWLSHVNCIVQGEVHWFQVLLGSLHPRSTGATRWSLPVLRGGAAKSRTRHILIITVDPLYLINFQLVLNAAYSCPSSIDCMHWSLKQSQIQYQHQKMQDKD